MKNARTYKAAQEKLFTYIRAQGGRPSKVRNMVLEQACLLPSPFTADQLIEVCAQERISVGTIYNALNTFIDAQIVHAITRQRGQSATEYEVITGVTNSLQMICTKCGRIADISDKAISRLVQERKYSNFNMLHFSLFVYGECKICRRKMIKRQ